MDFIQAYFWLLKPFKKKMLLVALLILAFESFKLAPPYIFSKFLDQLLQVEKVGYRSVLMLALLIFGLRLIVVLIDRIAYYLIPKLVAEVEKYLYTQTTEKLLALPFSWHENRSSGTIISQIERARPAVQWDITGSAFWEFLPPLLGFLVATSLFATTTLKLTIVFILPFPALVLSAIWLAGHLSVIRQERESLSDEAGKRLGEILSNILLIKALGTEKRELKNLSLVYEAIRKNLLRIWQTEETAALIWQLILNTTKLALLGLGLLEVKNGSFSVGQLVLVVTITDIAYGNLNQFYYYFRKVLSAKARTQALVEILREPVPGRASPGVKLEPLKGRVVFEEVFFSYGNGSNALKGVSFVIEEGETVGIVGRSGSGKTTLIKLLLGLYQPDSGRILIDGQNLANLDPDNYLSQVGYVPQTDQVFSGTVADNILYGLPDTRLNGSYKNELKGPMIKAAQAASAHEFIQKLPRGYNTLVGERGVKLSGGEAQRVRIALALIRNPKILIFDEATSHLDPEAERAIQHHLELHRAQNITRLVIAHRLSTVAHADKIIVLEDGQIAEQGTHHELLERKGVYYRLYQAQSLEN